MHEIPILGRLFELRKFLMQSDVAILLHTCSSFFFAILMGHKVRLRRTHKEAQRAQKREVQTAEGRVVNPSIISITVTPASAGHGFTVFPRKYWVTCSIMGC